MPIINLKIQGKQAIGDGTKIVCMNGDYIVRLECIDCDGFTSLPVKQLVLKAGTDCQEAPIESIEVDGTTFLQAELPTVEYQKTVELGVCGKETEDGEPEYTSKPAVFECEKSILCGVAVIKKDPVLNSLDVSQNGKYLASEQNIDGFYEVNVAVDPTPSEQRTVELSMAGGSQVIEPSGPNRVMSQVIVTKPMSLIPSNIRAGYSIGGVVGTYDKILTEKEVYTDGEYLPPAGTDGFSKVIVNVGSSNYAKLLRVGESFSYDYNTSVNITLDTPGIIKYENNGDAIIFTAVGKGSCSVILKDFDESGKIVNTVHYAIVADIDSDRLLPKDIDTPSGMQQILDLGIVGSVVKYIGDSAPSYGYVKDGIYIVEEE